MPTTDFQPLLNLLGEFWKQHRDLPKIKKFWEGLVRGTDDEWAQLQQATESRSILTVPTYFYHTYLYREIDNWRDTGVFHRHFKKTFRSTAGQTVFYLGTFVEGSSTRVFMDGKELDGSADPFVLTDEQDATQPGINPRGTRLVFRQALHANASIQVIAMRETFWIDHLFTTSVTSFPFTYESNDLSVRIVIDSFDITNTVQFDVTGKIISYRPPTYTNPNSTDVRVFYQGERIRVVDVTGSIQQITILQTSATVTLPIAVNPAASVYRVIGLDVSPGKVVLESNRLYIEGQMFPPNTRVRVVDQGGIQTYDLTAPTPSISLEREVNVDTAEVLYFSAGIYKGVTVSTTGVTFDRSFQAGIRLYINGHYSMLHDHASYHEELTAASDRVSVPRTRPWVLDIGLNETPECPIEVYVDGMLQHPSSYIFLPTQETYTIRFMNGVVPNLLPAGTMIDLMYVDHEDDRLHKHVIDRYMAADGEFAFALSEAHSLRYPVYIRLDGVFQGNPENYGYTKNREYIQLKPPIIDETIVKIEGMRLEFPYQADVDTDLVDNDFISDGLPVSRIYSADTLQNGIDKEVSGETFISLERNTGEEAPESGFSITQIPSSTSGFTLKSTEVIHEAWFKDTFVDEQTAQRNFGDVIGVQGTTSEAYVRALRGMFAAYFRGSQTYTLENFICFLMGSSFLDNPATLVRVNEDNGRAVTVRAQSGSEQTYTLSNSVPDRLWYSGIMPRYHAVTAYCQFLPLTADNCPWLPVAAEEFSDDFYASRRLDVRDDAEISGNHPEYTSVVNLFVDSTKDFVEGEEGEVWIGDLIWVEWSTGEKEYARILEVIDNHSLRVRLTVPWTSIGYGQQAYGGGTPGVIHAYGGVGPRTTREITNYIIYARKTRRLDTHRFLDALEPEDFEYLTNSLLPIFQPFVSLIRFHWEGLYEGALDNVKLFLDTAKGAASQYIAFSSVKEDEGLSDDMAIELVEDSVDIELIPNIFAVGLGAIDGGGLIGSSVEVA